ncbi:MAG: right-handed parallel beta-helix repeat-containing protein [Myxococcales bacterium]|nr:right-handed parallel beta-helix repeat-containing protein [Myxococcales bacterium]
MKTVAAITIMAWISLLIYACTASTPLSAKAVSEPVGPTIVVISPAGQKDGDGSILRPYASLQYALQHSTAEIIRLMPGTYDEDQLIISRPVQIEGVQSATISTHTFIGADNVQIKQLRFLQGLRVGLARNVVLRDVDIIAGKHDQALMVHGSDMILRDSMLRGGLGAVLETTSSTVVVDNSELIAERSERNILIDRSKVDITNTTCKGGQLAIIHIVEGSTLAINQSHLGPAQGSGLMLYGRDSFSTISNSTLHNISGYSILAHHGALTISSSTISAGGSAAIYTTGAKIFLSDSILSGVKTAVIHTAAHKHESPHVELTNLQIHHGLVESALLIEAGYVRLKGVHTTTVPLPLVATSTVFRASSLKEAVNNSTIEHSNTTNSSTTGIQLSTNTSTSAKANNPSTKYSTSSKSFTATSSASLNTTTHDTEEPPSSNSTPTKIRPAILVRNSSSKLVVSNTHISHPRGVGLVAENDATIDIDQLVISNPAGDGISLSNLREKAAQVRNTTITHCHKGVGLRVLDSQWVQLDSLRVSNCPKSSVIFGDNSRGSIRSSQLQGSRLGIGVFGGSSLIVSTSTVLSSVWSVFGDCIDNTQVIDQGDNIFDSHSRFCP